MARRPNPFMTDADNPASSDADLAAFRPAAEMLPPAVFERLTRKPGRPKAEAKRISVTIRIDPETLAAYKAGGAGWQTRMNEALTTGVLGSKLDAATAAKTPSYGKSGKSRAAKPGADPMRPARAASAKRSD